MEQFLTLFFPFLKFSEVPGPPFQNPAYATGSKESHCLTRCVALRIKNLSASSRYFSKLKDLSLDELAMRAECLKKDSPDKLNLPKLMEEDQLDDLELDGPIIYIEDLGWNRLGLHPREMMNVIEGREVWRLNLELLKPSRKSGQ